MFLEPLELRRLFAGVTILTHGLNGTVNGWIAAATADIAQRIGADDTSIYDMVVNKNSKGKLAVTSFELDHGPGLDKSVNAEAIVRLDWSDVSNGDFSARAVGDVVASYLMTSHGTERPLAGLPIHVVGHSRGASVVSDIAQRLGERGIWVDKSTFID